MDAFENLETDVIGGSDVMDLPDVSFDAVLGDGMHMPMSEEPLAQLAGSPSPASSPAPAMMQELAYMPPPTTIPFIKPPPTILTAAPGTAGPPPTILDAARDAGMGMPPSAAVAAPQPRLQSANRGRWSSGPRGAPATTRDMQLRQMQLWTRSNACRLST